MLNRLKERWRGLSRTDQVLLVLAEVSIVAFVLWLIPVSEVRADWQNGIVAVGLVFGFFQGVIFFVVGIVASGRRKRATVTRTRTATEKGSGWGFVVLIVLAVVLYWVGGYAADWTFPESEWATKWRYGLDDDLKDADYVIEKHPHDCEFWSAPLGDKHCHYDKAVITVRVRNGQSGGRAVSYDDGKTWANAEAGTRARVFVSWTKIQD